MKKGARTMLDLAKEGAAKQIQNAAPGSRFILLTNDKPTSYRPEPADKIFGEVSRLEFSATPKTSAQVLATAQSMLQRDEMAGADLYYYSDFQKTAFPAQPDKSLLKNINFYGIPQPTDNAENVYIDTAYLTIPILQTGKNNYLVVHTQSIGSNAKEAIVVQLTVNGQVKSAATLHFADKTESIDTLSFQVNDASWQKLQLTLNDAQVKFDDTFRISARSSSSLSVLVLNEGQPNPYLQAAFRAYNGFRLNQSEALEATKDWNNYNVVILNGVTRISAALGKAISDALQQGQSVCIFPGKNAAIQSINEGLRQIGDIQITALDTIPQPASNLQQGSALVRDLFEKIPENVQLPLANWHYSLTAGLNANQQSILSFRNGDPFLARYTPSRGQLYICATSADLSSGNFPGSYFFAPFLYQMAIQSGSSNIYAITAGAQQPVYIPLLNAIKRNTMHVTAQGVDIIPPQRPNGAGLDVFVDQAVQHAGFYNVAAPAGDTTQVALNQDKQESKLANRTLTELKNGWQGANIKWLEPSLSTGTNNHGTQDFPLWKICILIALFALGLETWILARPKKSVMS